MAKKYQQTYLFGDGTTSSLSAERLLERLLKEAFREASEGDRTRLDTLLQRICRGEAVLLTKELNPPRIKPRLPDTAQLKQEAQELLNSGVPKHKIASTLGSRYFVKAGHVRKKLKQ